ncbi:hypothetical protein CS063_16755 [Sporanaerobium hydrogeniformans]|uniref:Uncharacterized protein n=1 Tax=Sporanaerobium hydrogeniformans TaxID=3072179 RepID=A0AC61D6B2_9FIRM|nr:sugar ABC transporter substrate-binding protein [Sporanaerobium hydrogeniformans]PHV69259.1 hypothetical protein CS063_16755 [Sporanaerobium hydrogeniformans]
MNLKKLAVFGMAMTVGLTSLVGCGSKQEGSEAAAQTEGSTGSKQEIKMWSKASGTDPALDAIITAFNESQDKYTVKYEGYGDNYANVVNMALTSGDAPDIFELGGNFSVPTLIEQKLIAPVGDVITEDMKADIFEPVFNQIELYGDMYSIPTRVTAFRLLYNKDLFEAAGLNPEAPPTTLEEMREMAKIITEKGEGKSYGFGLYLGAGNIWERVLDPMTVAANVAGEYGFDFTTGQFDITKQQRLLEFYVDLAKDGSLFPGYETLAVDPMRSNFAQGNVGMYIDGNWTSGLYSTQIKTDINWGTAAIPVFADETYTKGLGFAGVDFAVASSSKNQEGAKEFLRFLLQNSEIAQQFKAEPKTYLPANDVAALPVEEAGLQGLEYNFKLDDIAPLPMTIQDNIAVEGDNRNKVFTNLFLKIVTGENVDLTKELETLTQRYNDALAKALEAGTVKESDIKIEGFKLEER